MPFLFKAGYGIIPDVMQAVLKINMSQIKQLIDQIPNRDKVELSRYLDEITLKNRMKALRKKASSIALSDIKQEVESVRKKRYA